MKDFSRIKGYGLTWGNVERKKKYDIILHITPAYGISSSLYVEYH